MKITKAVKSGADSAGVRGYRHMERAVLVCLVLVGSSLPAFAIEFEPIDRFGSGQKEASANGLSEITLRQLADLSARKEKDVFFVPLGDASDQGLTAPTTPEIQDDDLDHQWILPGGCGEAKQSIGFLQQHEAQDVYSVSRGSLKTLSKRSGARCSSYREFQESAQSSSPDTSRPPKPGRPLLSPDVCRLSLSDGARQSIVEDHDALFVTPEVINNYAGSLFSRSRAFRLGSHLSDDAYFQLRSGDVQPSSWVRVLQQRITGLPFVQDGYMTPEQFDRVNQARIDESLGDETQRQILMDARVHMCLGNQDLGPFVIRALSTHCGIGTLDVFGAVWASALNCPRYSESHVASDMELLLRIDELKGSWFGSLSWWPWSNTDEIEEYVVLLVDRYDQVLGVYWRLLNNALSMDTSAPESFQPLVSAVVERYPDSQAPGANNFSENLLSSTALYYALSSGRLSEDAMQDRWRIAAKGDDVRLCLERASGGTPAYFDEDSYAAIQKEAKRVGLMPITNLVHVSTLAVLEISPYAADSCVFDT